MGGMILKWGREGAGVFTDYAIKSKAVMKLVFNWMGPFLNLF